MSRQLRLAIRQEGTMVNAYVASMGSMQNALHIGSISTGALNMRPELFKQFQELMTAAMVAIVEVGGGLSVESVHAQAAPVHEKASHA